MRYLLLISFVLCALYCQGRKDPCKRIITDTDKNTGAITRKSPDLQNITVIKQFREDTFFALLLHFADEHDHFGSHGATVTFEDGTVISDESAKVVCTQQMSVVMSGSMSAGGSSSGKYMLQAFVRITDENAALFMLQRISKITLHNAIRGVSKGEAEKVVNYVRCLK